MIFETSMAHVNINTVLLNGSLDGPRKVDMGLTQTCIMFVIPRNDIQSVSEEKLIHQHCFYILLGKDATGHPKAYIGQSYDFMARVRDHQVKKGFWDTALVFVSKTDEIFASEVAYLEYCGISSAISAENYNLDENKQVPKKPKISPNQESGMELFFRDIKLLTRFYNNCCLFEDTTSTQALKTNGIPAEESHVFNLIMNKKGIKARIRYYEKSGRYVLLSGSTIAAEDFSSVSPSISKLRAEALKTAFFRINGTTCDVLKDYEIPVTSPSSVSGFCVGTSRNGSLDLVDDSGKTYKELYKC